MKRSVASGRMIMLLIGLVYGTVTKYVEMEEEKLPSYKCLMIHGSQHPASPSFTSNLFRYFSTFWYMRLERAGSSVVTVNCRPPWHVNFKYAEGLDLKTIPQQVQSFEML